MLHKTIIYIIITVSCLFGGAAATEKLPCAPYVDRALGGIDYLLSAKEPDYFTYAKKMKAELEAAPPECRKGLWYVAVARFLRLWHGGKVRITVGTVHLKSAREALTAGLAAEPSNPALLAYIAYLSKIRPKTSPPLPKDACQRVTRQKQRLKDPQILLYICGHAALRRKKFREAANYFSRIDFSNYLARECYRDARLLQAEALLRVGDKKGARKAVKAAKKQIKESSFPCWFGNFDDEYEKDLKKRLKSILKKL